MPDVQKQKQMKVTTRSGSLSLVREVLQGPEGRLFEAIPSETDAFAPRSRFLVFAPHPDCRSGYLERLKRIEHLTYHGWVVPDTIVHDPEFGLVAIYRLEQGVPISEATDSQLGGIGDRSLLIARLCRVVAHGHDAEVFHGNISDALVICNGGYPMLIDAPVGPEHARDTTHQTGRASADIRAMGALLAKLVLDRAPQSGRADAPGLLDEVARIVATATADEPHPRFVQISRMEDVLGAAIDPPRVLVRDSRFHWPAAVGVAAALAVAAWAGFLAIDRDRRDELAEVRARVAEAEVRLEDRRIEAERLAAKLHVLPDMRERALGMLRYSDEQGVVADSLLAFSATEQLLWPLGTEQSHLATRLSFQHERLVAGRQVIDKAYARSEEHNLEVILTELLVSTWEFETGEVSAAADTLRRVVPKLQAVCGRSDPLAVGAAQLLAYTSDLAADRPAVASQAYEPWVKRIIDIAVSARTKAAGPYGERYRPLAERLNDEENYERDMEFTRSVTERMEQASSVEAGF
jgi:hypothetical protein